MIPLAVVAVVTVLIVQHLPHHRHGPAHPRSASASQAALPLVPVGLHVREPGGVSGLPMSRDHSLRLPLAGPQPAWLSLGTGHEQPIRGLPRDESGYQFNRVPGGWAVQAGSGGPVRCGSCAGPQVPVYFIGLPLKGLLAIGLVLVSVGVLEGVLAGDFAAWLRLVGRTAASFRH